MFELYRFKEASGGTQKSGVLMRSNWRLRGSQWFQRVSGALRRHFREAQEGSGGISELHRVSQGILERSFQQVPRDSKKFEGGSRGLETLQGVSEAFHGVSGVSGTFQGISGVFQEVSGVFRWSQKVAVAFQEVPGNCKWVTGRLWILKVSRGSLRRFRGFQWYFRVTQKHFRTSQTVSGDVR